MASTAASAPGPGNVPGQPKTYQPTVPQIKTADVPKRLQEGDEFIKWDEVRLPALPWRLPAERTASMGLSRCRP